MSIHPTAIIDPSSQIGEGVEIGAYTVIGPNCAVGDRTTIGPHVVLEEYTLLGRRMFGAGRGHGSRWPTTGQ